MFKIIFYTNDTLINIFLVSFIQSTLVFENIKIYFEKKRLFFKLHKEQSSNRKLVINIRIFS
jgi:hypothetical protein